MNLNERFLWNENMYNTDPWKDKILFGGIDEKERDLMYMREMYPQSVRFAQDAVEDEMNRIDNSRSFIYDEYPDKYLLRRLILEIVDIYMENQEEEQMDRMTAENIITILVLNEIYRRRQKRWW